ncbi:MAG: hypothetical protein EXR43_02130 [Dehalococcoidia bacterium]|nr:hypothetical protein [Dehalococcoidia bacterium]
MPTIADLAVLQELDTSLDEQRATLRHLDMRLADQGAYYEARVALQTSESHLRDLDSVQREAETRAEEVRSKLQAEERRLYDGSVVSSRELTTLQQEVANLQKQLRTREETLLAVMTQVEDVAGAHVAARARSQEAREQRQAEVAQLEERRTVVERAIGELEAKHRDAVGRIAADVLAVYEDLRRRRRGRAVVHIERGACGGCRVNLPGGVASQARSATAVARCPSCERFLAGG